MNVNFGLFPTIEAPKKDDDGRRLKGKARSLAKKRAQSARSLQDWSSWLDQSMISAAAE